MRLPQVQAMGEISESECLEILDNHNVGRIALQVGPGIQIFPVNYSMNGRVIAIRTGTGAIMANAPGKTVAFEIDDHDTSAGSGWSVMVQGTAHDATDSFDDVSWAARAASPRPLAPGAKPFWLAVEPTRISGRRFGAEGGTRLIKRGPHEPVFPKPVTER